ncbi:MAG: hypothetical protein Q4E63_05420 [Prevotellaceae bacterium]|nr:hypothetical protein [Prevotellaceae bacterium]MDO4932077.1 hypothetical protein [Prevotellaceae bacterium]
MRTLKTVIVLTAIMLLADLQNLATMSAAPKYDERPYNEKPTLERPAWPNYNINNDNSFAIFSNILTITNSKALGMSLRMNTEYRSGERYSLYRCKDATYIAMDIFIPNIWHHLCFYEGRCIIDADTGDEYQLRKLEYFPLNQCIWIHNMRNKWVRFIFVYPPLPDKVKRIQLFNPGGPGRTGFSSNPKRTDVINIDKLRKAKPASEQKRGRIIY